MECSRCSLSSATRPLHGVVAPFTSAAATRATRSLGAHLVRSLLVSLAVLVAAAVASDQGDYDYSYGDTSYNYDDLSADTMGLVDGRSVPRGPPLPLCCPPGNVYDYVRCRAPSPGGEWVPQLDAAPHAPFVYSTGFPRCTNTRRADLYQSEVFVSNSTLYVPHYLQLDPVLVHDYCVVRVEDPQDQGGTCPRYGTKVYACVHGDKAMGTGAWVLVGLSHLLLLLAIVAHVVLPSLRALQGQYTLCLLITLLLYDVLQFPASALAFPSSLVACTALRAIKSFFFCCVFLWYNVVCFDVWRSVRSGRDLGGRRRFLLYSLYAWLLGAVLVTPVMVLSLGGSDPSPPPPGQDLPLCYVGLGVHVVLQLVQGATVVADLLLLGLAASHLCRYPPSRSLPRARAVFCVKQTAKLFLVMAFHCVFSLSPDVVDLRVIDLWQFTVLESVSVFSILVYRRSILRQIYDASCRSWFPSCRSDLSPQDSFDGGAPGPYTPSVGGAQAAVDVLVPEKIRLSSV